MSLQMPPPEAEIWTAPQCATCAYETNAEAGGKKTETQTNEHVFLVTISFLPSWVSDGPALGA